MFAQVLRAGADHPHHRRQRSGHQAAVGQRAGAQHQVDLAEMFALQVDEAADQAQLHVEAGVGLEEVGDRRGQVAAAEGHRRIDTDQALRRGAQGHRFGTGQAQFGDDPPGAVGEGQAGRRGAHRMGGAHQQGAADGAFQGVHPARHGGRGERVLARSGGEAAAIEDIEVENELFAEGIGQHAHAFA